MKRVTPLCLLFFFVLMLAECKTSGNGEITFSDPTVIYSTSNSVSNTSLVIDNSGNLLFVWQEEIPTDNWEIMFIRSTDKGASWSPPVNISKNPVRSVSPKVAYNNANELFVVWDDSTPGNRDIFFSRSVDNGLNWSSPLNISKTSTGDSHIPSFVVSSVGHLFLVWMEWKFFDGARDIYFSRSFDNGNTWSLPEPVINDSGISIAPDIADGRSGNLYLVWEDNITLYRDIYFSRSTDSGSTWSLSMNVSNTSGVSLTPIISSGSTGSMKVVWREDTTGNNDVFFCQSNDSGASWDPAYNISNNPGTSTGYDLAIGNSGSINVSWADNTSGWEVLFIQSMDNGITWSSALTVSSLNSCTGTNISIDSTGIIYIMWFDSNGGNKELHFCQSTE